MYPNLGVDYFRSMAKFHGLRVLDVTRETQDSVVVSFDVPDGLRSSFSFESGQYLTLRTDIEGEEVRRSYSLCSAPHENAWRVGIKEVPGGKFSTYANRNLAAGDVMDVMEPQGRFTLCAGQGLHHLGIAAGSGITPILSQVKDVLESDPTAIYTLFYSNKTAASTMFREELQDLKDRHMDRLRLFYLLTREPVDAELLSGRLDKARCTGLLNAFCQGRKVDAAYLCGPEGMIMSCKEALQDANVPEEAIRFELSRLPMPAKPQRKRCLMLLLPGTRWPCKWCWTVSPHRWSLPRTKHARRSVGCGLDAPYSCLGGVCCTCRAKLVKGQATMAVNYALEPGEVERGFVLACQAHAEEEKTWCWTSTNSESQFSKQHPKRRRPPRVALLM